MLQQLEQQLREPHADQDSQPVMEPAVLREAADQKETDAEAAPRHSSAELPDQDSSVAAGAAGLLAMTSTVERSAARQASFCRSVSSSSVSPANLKALLDSIIG